MRPLSPEDLDEFEDENGRPDPDNDGDGIADSDDECPEEPENINQYFDEDGCRTKSLVQVVRNQIVIKKTSFFIGAVDHSSCQLPVLDSVSTVLTQYPDIQIRIEGHTDSDGGEALNQRLSEKRANAVRDYLIRAASIKPGWRQWALRELRPMALNRSASGKAKNRRVEFHIVHGLSE